MARRSLIAALTVLAALACAGRASAAAGDLPRLVGSVPSGGLTANWYDDHSVIGDGHLSWSDQGAPPFFVNDFGQASQAEPKAIGFNPGIAVSGPGGLEVCGYPSGTVGWMRAYQAAPGAVTAAGSCPATEPAIGQMGWFRYVYGRHSPSDAFNRWHVMDLERFALVPMPGTNAPIVWDNHWGTCLNLASTDFGCPTDRAAGRLDVGVASGTPKTTGIYYTAPPGATDEQVIPIPKTLQDQLPNGQYQVVDLVNPYGIVQETGGAIGSVSCVTVNLTKNTPGYADISVPIADASPPTCYLPTTLDPMLAGPGADDPMAGADGIPDCGHTTDSHCWTDPNNAPHSGPYPAAVSLATGDPVFGTTTAVPNGSAIPAAVSVTGRRALIATRTVASTGTGPVAGSPGGAVPKAKGSSKALTTAKNRTTTALRRVFGKGLSRLKVSCKLKSGGASTCTVSWRKAGARYSGHVYLRTKTIKRKLRWQYRVDVTKKKGSKTTHVRRAYRTGGTA